MAQAIGCDLCQQESAVMMQSNLGNGSTIAVGESCMVTFFASSLTAMLSGAPPKMLNDLSAVLAPLGAIIGPDERPATDVPGRAEVEGWNPVGGMPPPKEIRAEDTVADGIAIDLAAPESADQ